MARNGGNDNTIHAIIERETGGYYCSDSEKAIMVAHNENLSELTVGELVREAQLAIRYLTICGRDITKTLSVISADLW